MSQKPVILVVDDDVPILILMRNLLREFDFEPTTAMTGADAIVRAREQRPDLILLDKNMPGMTGEEVVRTLRADPSFEDVPILILSGEPMAPDELRAIGADAAVLKPFDVPALVEQIREYVAVT